MAWGYSYIKDQLERKAHPLPFGGPARARANLVVFRDPILVQMWGSFGASFWDQNWLERGPQIAQKNIKIGILFWKPFSRFRKLSWRPLGASFGPFGAVSGKSIVLP